jgi:nucleoside-diphosphate-sugar epimerase
VLIEETRVAILGAGGFIGRAVVRAFAEADPGTSIQAMVRQDSKHPDLAGTLHLGDVRDVGSVRAAIRGANSVIHAASYVGYDPAQCRDTNVEGTLNVVDACAAEGVERLLYVSTASVYGSGPHRGAREHELEVRPESALSRSRADAENFILEAGGLVLRPHMVFGADDKWFGPSLVRFTHSIGGMVEGGATLVSVVHVDDVGSVAARLATADHYAPGAYNVAYDRPSQVKEIIELLQGDGVLSPRASIDREDAFALASAAGFSARQFALLTTDHWFSSEKLRAAIGVHTWKGSAFEVHAQ